MAKISEREIFIRGCVEKYSARLVCYVSSLYGNPEMAKDAVQDAFLKLCKHDNVDTERVGAWLYKVSRNSAIDMMRKNRGCVPADENVFASLKDSAPIPFEILNFSESSNMLLTEISKLTGRQAEVLMLRYFSGLSYSEISEIMDLPIGSVGVMISRALDALKIRIQGKGFEYGS